MLTRLSVTGFKSLIDVEVVFSPLTCIAGLNAAGKSNLLDVIMFLSDLTDYSIVEAASRVRDRAGLRRGEVESIFSRTREGVAPIIVLEAEFLVSKQVTDDFGQETDASATHLKYRIEIELIQASHVLDRYYNLHIHQPIWVVNEVYNHHYLLLYSHHYLSLSNNP